MSCSYGPEWGPIGDLSPSQSESELLSPVIKDRLGNPFLIQESLANIFG